MFGPIGPAGMILVMIVAAVVVHRPNGFFAMTNGIELNLLYVTGAMFVAFAGSGPYSLDAVLGIDRIWSVQATWVIIALGVAGAFVNLAVRRPPQAVRRAA